jgi:phage baseplate assembly protein W
MAIYSDIDIELEKASSGDIVKDEDIDAVKNSLTNIINTIQGSRRMLPEFAVDIHAQLFEPMDKTTAYNIGRKLVDAITEWEDRVTISNLNVHADYDKNQYKVTLDFTIESSKITETITYILKQR